MDFQDIKGVGQAKSDDFKFKEGGIWDDPRIYSLA